jgi:hypothetical protein
MTADTTSAVDVETGHTLAPDERRLARNALGLPNRRRRSYRNHFVRQTDETWERMVEAGFATVHRSGEPGGMHTYRLTRAGAGAALDPGECLDPEDFPSD